MPGKKRGVEDREPECIRQAPEKEKDKNGVERMPDDANRMMPARVVLKQRPIHHVRKPRDWMPVSRGAGRESPSDSLHRQARLHVRILRYIDRIIVIYEIVANGPAKDEQCSKKQCGTDRDRAAVKLHG